MSMKWGALTLAVLAAVVSGCGPDDPKASDEYRSLLAEVQALESQAGASRSDLAELQEQIEELEASTDSVLAAQAEAEANVAAAAQASDDAERRLTAASSSAETAQTEASVAREALRAAKSSDAYRQHLASQFENMLAVICPARTLAYLGRDPIGSSAFMTDQSLIGRNLNTEVEACVDQNYTDVERFLRQACGTRYDAAQVDKRPEDYVGMCFSGSGARVFQFDSNTGRCGFLATINSAFDAFITDGPEIDSTSPGCEEYLSPLVKGTRFDYWVVVRGAHTYDTQIGGNNTVVHLTLLYYRYY